MPAMFNLLLGEVWPRNPSTWLGTTVNAETGKGGATDKLPAGEDRVGWLHINFPPAEKTISPEGFLAFDAHFSRRLRKRKQKSHSARQIAAVPRVVSQTCQEPFAGGGKR